VVGVSCKQSGPELYQSCSSSGVGANNLDDQSPDVYAEDTQSLDAEQPCTIDFYLPINTDARRVLKFAKELREYVIRCVAYSGGISPA